MRLRSPRLRRLILAVGCAVSALAVPMTVAAPAVALPTVALPTVDAAAPTPTAPWPDRPPVGRAPDGTVTGGDGLASRGFVLPAGAPELPAGLTAYGWVVADADSGAVLGARDPHGRYYPASTLKTLTLLSLYDEIAPGTVVVGTDEDAGVEGTRVGIVKDGRYPVDLLFRALMMASGNDAANALARAAGGVPATLDLMTVTAQRLQAWDTVPGTPSGLDVAGQTTSAYDLVLVFRQLIDDPRLLGVMQTPTLVMPAVPPRYPAFQIQNQNPLLGVYDGALAGKNGFTDAARHTFVAAAERDGRRLIVSLVRGEQAPLRMADQAAALLDWGFSVPADTDPVGELVAPRDPDEPLPTAAPTTAPSSPTRTTAPARGASGPAPGATDAVATDPAAAADGANPPLLAVAGVAVVSAGGLILLLRLPRRRRRLR